jgi:uncharacterized protein
MSEPLRNRLGDSASPYLLQHAHNPVAWQPWDDAAIAHARDSGRPILLSIGYSACHWCHVMAHESFEDPVTAAAMNAHFVNVKVDREERPDLDQVYQLAHQVLNQRPGGWPLTAFLDPQTLLPFFSGTYFPPRARHGLPAFVDLLARIAEVFATHRDDLEVQGKRLAALFAGLDAAPDAPAAAAGALWQTARKALGERFDGAAGGFGSAPKFPMPATLEALLRHWSRSRRSGDVDRDSLDMVMTTLTRMARGGLFDHLGGGFCRYATDRLWLVPHFEKMLYDNGLLLSLYSDALGIGPDPLFEHVVDETAGWLLRDMQHPEGGFFSATDADSEGEEGRYYVWRRNEVRRLLDDDEYLVIETLYGLDRPANFEGSWILHRSDAWRAVAERLSLPPERAFALLASGRAKLLAARASRTPPAIDDKILAGWNAMAMAGLAAAAVRRGRSDWLQAAGRAADFVRERLVSAGRLHAAWRNGRLGHRAFLDDHAHLIDALVTLLSARWRDSDAEFARRLADDLLEHFEDRDSGGFFFTAHDQETLIHRSKPLQDDATPAGNAVAVRALGRLGQLLGDRRYVDAQNRTIDWGLARIRTQPQAFCGFLAAAVAAEAPGEQILLRGPADQLEPWLALARSGYHPDRAAFAVPYDEANVIPANLPRLVSADLRHRVVAYHCQGTHCSAPIHSLDALRSALS